MSDLSRGLAWIVLAGLTFVVFIVIVRYVGNQLHPVQTAFIRYALGLVVLLPWFLRDGLSLLRTNYPGRHAVRGVVHAIGVMLWFYAVTFLPIADATALSFTSPVFVAVGAMLFLGERLVWARIGCVVLGFAGILVITRPGFAEIGEGAIAMLLAAPLFAASKLLVKYLVAHDSSITIVAHLSIFATLTMLVPAVLVWQPPSLVDMALLLGTAVFATLSHICMAKGLALIDVGVAQPVEFLQLVWSTLFGLLLFGEVPEKFVWMGAGVVIVAASLNARYESRMARMPRRVP